jgi:hypothetical protein
MKRLLLVAFIGFVLAMWSSPLAALARTITVLNETKVLKIERFEQIRILEDCELQSLTCHFTLTR